MISLIKAENRQTWISRRQGKNGGKVWTKEISFVIYIHSLMELKELKESQSFSVFEKKWIFSLLICGLEYAMVSNKEERSLEM